MVAVAQVNNDGHITDWHTFQVEWDRSMMRVLKVATTPASFASCASTTS